MAFRFPWSNLHELNLDWILGKVKEFADLVPSMNEGIESAQTALENSQTALENSEQAVETVSEIETELTTVAGVMQVTDPDSVIVNLYVNTVKKYGKIKILNLTVKANMPGDDVYHELGILPDTFHPEESVSMTVTTGGYSVEARVRSNDNKVFFKNALIPVQAFGGGQVFAISFVFI